MDAIESVKAESSTSAPIDGSTTAETKVFAEGLVAYLEMFRLVE